MAGTSNPNAPNLAEEFVNASAERQKTEIEEEVFHKILAFWEALQELQLLYYCGEANTPRLLAKLEKYREYLHLSELGDPFEEGHMYELMLRKERETLNYITGTKSYQGRATQEVRSWMYLWKAFVEAYFDVIHNNFFK